MLYFSFEIYFLSFSRFISPSTNFFSLSISIWRKTHERWIWWLDTEHNKEICCERLRGADASDLLCQTNTSIFLDELLVDWQMKIRYQYLPQSVKCDYRQWKIHGEGKLREHTMGIILKGKILMIRAIILYCNPLMHALLLACTVYWTCIE